jgi:hypothetical protein
LAGIVPPVNVTFGSPVLPVRVPPQVVVAVPESTIPLGKVSTSGDERVAALLLGFVNVMVREEDPPALIVEGLKDLLSVGGVAGIELTVKVATAAPVLLPLLVCNEPAGSELK